MTPYRPLSPLRPGTPVRGKYSGLSGIVQPYDAEHATLGLFPVKFENGIWVMCGADDVYVVTALNEINTPNSGAA